MRQALLTALIYAAIALVLCGWSILATGLAFGATDPAQDTAPPVSRAEPLSCPTPAQMNCLVMTNLANLVRGNPNVSLETQSFIFIISSRLCEGLAR